MIIIQVNVLKDTRLRLIKSFKEKILTLKHIMIAVLMEIVMKLEKTILKEAQTAIKVVIGGAVLSYASRNSNFAKTLVEILDKSVTRDNDLKRINATLDNLRKKAGLSSQSTQAGLSSQSTQTTNSDQPQPMKPNYHQG